MNTALILVDIQNDYFAGGRMELVGMEAASERAAALLDGFRGSGRPVFHVQHIARRPGATFFLEGTEGAEIHESVRPATGEVVVEKSFPNSFRETALLDELKRARVKGLAICGAMTHMCIDATTRAAFDLGFRCTVASDACATRDLQFEGQTLSAATVHGAFLAALTGVYAKVMTAEAVEKGLAGVD